MVHFGVDRDRREVQLSVYLPELRRPGSKGLREAIQADIRRGSLRAGQRLPGSRRLAEALGMSRTTVVRATDELVAEGWLEARAGSGLYVLAPDSELPQSRIRRGLGFDLRGVEVEGERRLHAPASCPLRLVGGTPDLRQLPLVELTRAYRRALRGRGRRLVAYGDPYGEPRLREALARWVSESRGLALAPDQVLVTRGSQMALYLLAHALLRPGDRVAVEALGYPPAWHAFRRAGAELVGVPVDEEGMVVDEIPADVRAVYVTPHHQYPSGAVLSARRRLGLLELARRRRIPVLEDDYDHEYHYEGRPVLPLAALDRDGIVVTIGTLSKAFAPGLRLGWVIAPPELLGRLAAHRRVVDRQGDRVVEQAVADLLEEGLVQRHIRRTRRIYAARRDFLLAGLRGLPVEPRPVPGGLAIWARTSVNPDRWAARAEARGLFFAVGSAFTLDRRPLPFIRLGFAAHDLPELGRALALLRSTSGARPRR